VVITEETEIVIVRGGSVDPLLCEFVEVSFGRLRRQIPIGDVLALAPDRQAGRVTPTRMGAERRLDHRQHPVGGDAHTMAEPA